jgi:hypothetical protein
MLLLERKTYLRLIGADCETPPGAVGQVRFMQAFTPKEAHLSHPLKSEHLSQQSTTPHYLVNTDKVCKNRHFYK